MPNRKKMLEWLDRYVDMRVENMDTAEAYDLAERYVREFQFNPSTVANMTDKQLEEHLNEYGIIEMYSEYEAEEQLENENERTLALMEKDRGFNNFHPMKVAETLRRWNSAWLHVIWDPKHDDTVYLVPAYGKDSADLCMMAGRSNHADEAGVFTPQECIDMSRRSPANVERLKNFVAHDQIVRLWWD